jgi:hypothetical protein
MSTTTDPFDAIEHAIAMSGRDWSIDKDHAALYAITLGWAGAMSEVAKRHKWDAATVERLEALHAAWIKAKRQHQKPPLQLIPWSASDASTIADRNRVLAVDDTEE